MGVMGGKRHKSLGREPAGSRPRRHSIPGRCPGRFGSGRLRREREQNPRGNAEGPTSTASATVPGRSSTRAATTTSSERSVREKAHEPCPLGRRAVHPSHRPSAQPMPGARSSASSRINHNNKRSARAGHVQWTCGPTGDKPQERGAPMSRVMDNPGPLRVKRCTDGRRRLTDELRVDVSGDCGQSLIVEIPTCFVTDYSSLPWGTRWIVKWSRVDVAGVVHDYLYRCDATAVGDDGTPTQVLRPEADKIWRMIARSGFHRANCVQAFICWFALCVFGRRAWRKKCVCWIPNEASERRGRKRVVGCLVCGVAAVVLLRNATWNWETIGAGLLPVLVLALFGAAMVFLLTWLYPAIDPCKSRTRSFLESSGR